MKILLLSDGLGWIVDKDCQALADHLPEVDISIKYYTKMTPEEFIEESEKNDLVHYGNWDIKRFKYALPHIHKPLLVSVRSHRYDPYVKELLDRKKTWFHVINEDLLNDFPGATYLPEGIFDQFRPDHDFTVGFAGYHDQRTHRYKGVYLIEQACQELGVKFKPAFNNIRFEDMPDYYRSIDLYVCASEAEGFSTAVMECMSMNVPVITVDTGVPSKYNIIKIERSVEGIKEGIQKFYTQDLVKEYRWDKLAPKYKKLYEEILNQER